MSTPLDENLYLEAPDLPNYPPYQFHDPKTFDIDPRLLSASTSPLSSPLPTHLTHLDHPTHSSYQNFTPYPSTPPFFDTNPVFEPLRHQMLGHRRSVSVPPEDMEEQQAPMVFHRGGHWLGDSTTEVKGGRRRQKRAVPYPLVKERKGWKGPTSAPVEVGLGVGAYGTRDIGAGVGNATVMGVQGLAALDAMVLGQGTLGTLGMGVMGFAERIQRDVDGLKGFLSRGVGGGDEVETIRQEKRAFNHTVTSLDETLDILPLPNVSDIEIPSTGREIRDANGDVMDALLKAYDIPFEKESFVFERKLVFLRFLGVGRVLMHAVLD